MEGEVSWPCHVQVVPLHETNALNALAIEKFINWAIEAGEITMADVMSLSPAECWEKYELSQTCQRLHRP
jgi:hypothetical protein